MGGCIKEVYTIDIRGDDRRSTGVKHTSRMFTPGSVHAYTDDGFRQLSGGSRAVRTPAPQKKLT